MIRMPTSLEVFRGKMHATRAGYEKAENLHAQGRDSEALIILGRTWRSLPKRREVDALIREHPAEFAGDGLGAEHGMLKTSMLELSSMLREALRQ